MVKKSLKFTLIIVNHIKGLGVAKALLDHQKL